MLDHLPHLYYLWFMSLILRLATQLNIYNKKRMPDKWRSYFLFFYFPPEKQLGPSFRQASSVEHVTTREEWCAENICFKLVFYLVENTSKDSKDISNFAFGRKHIELRNANWNIPKIRETSTKQKWQDLISQTHSLYIMYVSHLKLRQVLPDVMKLELRREEL